MKIAFDIGGVISKYPDVFRNLINVLDQHWADLGVYIITDMHNKDEVIKILKDNHIIVDEDKVYCADYEKYGELCKAVLLKQLSIDIFVDDFVGYTSWDSSLGEAPIRLLVMPDPFKPYWHKDWKTNDKSGFCGRNCYVKPKDLRGEPYGT